MRAMQMLTVLLGAPLLVSGASANREAPLTEFVVQADLEQIESASDGSTDSDKLVRDSIEIIRGRLAAIEITDYNMDYLGAGRIIIEIPGPRGRKTLEGILGIRPALDFKFATLRGCSGDASQKIAAARGKCPPTVESIGGRNIIRVFPSMDAVSKEYSIVIEFDEAGAERIAELTRMHVGQRAEIIFDGEIISQPMILEPILDGTLQLSGGLTAEGANELAIRLGSGALPASFEIVQQRLKP